VWNGLARIGHSRLDPPEDVVEAVNELSILARCILDGKLRDKLLQILIA
jgi:hypothetical protein